MQNLCLFCVYFLEKFDKILKNQKKLGDAEFDNLLFLWCNEENDEFVGLDTFYDDENSTVSVVYYINLVIMQVSCHLSQTYLK